MAGQDFASLVAAGLLRDVEQITVQGYLTAHPGESRPDAYHWLRYEDPDPIARLADGVNRLRREGAKFDVEAVDKACAEALKLGYSN
jgi:hypothetical protein